MINIIKFKSNLLNLIILNSSSMILGLLEALWLENKSIIVLVVLAWEDSAWSDELSIKIINKKYYLNIFKFIYLL
jgi:hypothetical protein